MMKKTLLIAAVALMAYASQGYTVSHNLEEHGLVADLNYIYDKAENPDNLAPIIKKYHELAQQGQVEISFEDLKALHEEMCALLAKESKHQF